MILGMPISLLLQWWWQATKQAISLATAITATTITTAATSEANDLAAITAFGSMSLRLIRLAPRGMVRENRQAGEVAITTTIAAISDANDLAAATVMAASAAGSSGSRLVVWRW